MAASNVGKSKGLKQLNDENRQLRRLVFASIMDTHILQDVL